MNAEAAEFHPSPMVQASYGGRFGYSSYYRGGRGGFGRGRAFRGRGRFQPGGRAAVVSMIASKTWTRQKTEDAGGAAPASAGDGGGGGAAEGGGEAQES